MSQTVILVHKQQIENIKKYYSSNLQPTPSGAIFRAKTKTCTITAYKSGKVLFQGTGHEIEARRWQSNDLSSNKSTNKTSSAKAKHSYYPPSTIFTSNHMGTDEAGTGDYFGPITVAAVYVTQEQVPFLREIGVQDSKNLKDPKITEIAKKIVKEKLPYSLVKLHNPQYNDLQVKGWSQGKMKTILHYYAIQKLMKKIDPIKPEAILVDQFSEPGVFIRHLQSEKHSLPENIYFMTKAESYSIAVAAASIIARASFVLEMDRLSEEAGLYLPKGASRKVDETASTLIKEKGRESLQQYAKVHFANTTKAEAYL
ncbi:ribonuclease HIII [Bacillaceae bacterium S4-13-56]